MKSRTCPPAEELTAYTLGKTPHDRSEEIEGHLLDCPQCQASLETCGPQDDTFLSRLRQSESDDRLWEEPECQEAIARVASLAQDPTFSTRKLMAEATDDAAPHEAIGPYRLLEKLGAGGMGAVYKAYHTRLKRVVALKLLPAERMRDPEAVTRFEREMEAVGKLDHPNIVRATDADEDDGTHYLVMEYVDGLDLGKLVRRHGPLPIADACELIRQAAIGLQHAHEHGLVHRDIKPSNIMVATVAGSLRESKNISRSKMPTMNSISRSETATVKILDLGLALLEPSQTDTARDLTTTGQTMGTLDYMAPEQGGDSHGVDIRADIYSLGATLYKLLTGEPIYHGPEYQTPVQKLMALISHPAPPITERRPDVPEPLAAVVHRMIATDKADRFSTPAEVAEALAPWCQDSDLAELVHRSPHAPREDRLAERL